MFCYHFSLPQLLVNLGSRFYEFPFWWA